MARYVFKLPDVGEGTAEAELVAWHVKVGDAVEEDQPLADVMTDKATVELTSPVAGVVLELKGEPGEMRAVKSELVILETQGAGADAASIPAPAAGVRIADDDTPPVPQPPQTSALSALGNASALAASEAGSAPSALGNASALPPSGSGSALSAPGNASALPGRSAAPAFTTRAPGAKPLASPAVRRRAHELGIDLQYVPGEGPAGRIGHADLDAYVAAKGATGAPQSASPSDAWREGVEVVKIIGLRRKIAQQMQEAKRRIPHFAYIEEVDVTALEDLRAHLNATRAASQPKLTLLPFLIRAVARAVPGWPNINARFDDDAGVLHRFAGVHLGMATQTPGGLIVPVIRHAEALDLWALALEITRLAKAVREGTARKEELTGSTLTLTSLGTLGGVAHTPVVNYPETAIIGPNKIIERPVVRGGQIVIRKMMNLSSSFDHRVVDGYDAAEFVQKVKGLLEQPATLFMG